MEETAMWEIVQVLEATAKSVEHPLAAEVEVALQQQQQWGEEEGEVHEATIEVRWTDEQLAQLAILQRLIFALNVCIETDITSSPYAMTM